VDLLETLGAAIVAGSALGATIAGFFAYRQKSLVTVLREGNQDYKERVDQLERDREFDQRQLEEQARQIEALQQEKRLPLDELTRLIVEQHSEQIRSTENLATQMATVAKQMAKIVKHLSDRGEV
jgi:response regulator of citrate/malate metabolism